MSIASEKNYPEIIQHIYGQKLLPVDELVYSFHPPHDATLPYGITALSIAAENKHENLVDLLLSYGANPKGRSQMLRGGVSNVDHLRKSLTFAKRGGHQAIIQKIWNASLTAEQK